MKTLVLKVLVQLAELPSCGVHMGKTVPLASQSERAIQWETGMGKNNKHLMYVKLETICTIYRIID